MNESKLPAGQPGAGQEAPRIEFPCEYPIKVMGLDCEAFREETLLIIRRHSPDLVEESLSYQASRNGKYLSIRVTIIATGKPQLQALFDDLKATGRVAMVL